jgi:hypothetical protein
MMSTAEMTKEKVPQDRITNKGEKCKTKNYF